MIFEFPKFTLDIDVEKTRTYYNTADFVSESCSCSGCRNYEQAVDLLPEKIISFFSQFGIEMKKIREVYVNRTNADDTVFYGGFYHVCGKIIKGKSAWVAVGKNTKHWKDKMAYAVTDDFKVSFGNDCSLLDENFPLPAIQVDISADMPWVLDEQNDYEKDSNRKSNNLRN